MSNAELLLAEQLRQAGIPFLQEVRFAKPRRFRSDFYIHADNGDFLVEIEGGAWVNGRHSRGTGMASDCEKSALAAIKGYRFMRVLPEHVEDGRALAWIREAVAA
jgi:hypothetical protein